MKSINVPYAVSKFKFHDTLKSQILKAIDDPEHLPLHTVNEKLNKTDWNVASNKIQKYVELLKEPLDAHLRSHYGTLGIESYKIHNYWFQQYTSNGFHDWHCHPECHYTNIYYVELPNKTYSTELLDPMTRNQVIKLDVEEGDIVSFPSFIFHRSPKILDESQKTIIAFNTSILSCRLNSLK